MRISFKSKHGPLAYATGEFDDWRDNLRAIALSLEALRAVDRYGVSKRGEQYRGWRQISATTGNADDLLTTRAQAVEFLSRWDGDVKEAFRATHPDHGGDPDVFRLVVRARDLIGGAA